MSSQVLGSVSCVSIRDFSSVLEIAFGVNLALPVFRELVFFNRRSIVKRLPAIQSLIDGKIYDNDRNKNTDLGALSRSRLDLIACDKYLFEKINICSIITFIFSIVSLGWIVAGIYNPACLSGAMTFFAIWLNFLPLPISIAFLWIKSQSQFHQINKDLDDLLERVM